MGQLDNRNRFDLVAAITAALDIADKGERPLIAALLQNALDLALQEDASAIAARGDG